MRASSAALVTTAAGQHLAEQLATAALPLAAVLLLGAGPGMAGMLLAAQGAAWLLCSLPAGLLVDAWPRRTLLRAAGLLAAAGLVAGALPGAWLGQAWLLGVGCFAASAGTAGFVLAAGALVPELAGPGGLAAANARLELARAAVTLIAPPLAGFLAVQGLLPVAFLAAGLAGLVAALAAVALGRDAPRPGPVPPQVPLTRRLREGAGFVLRQPLLRAIGACALCWNFGFFALLAAFVPFGLGPAGLDPAGLGFAQAGLGAGLLAGASLAPVALKHLPPRTVLIAGPGLSLAAPLLMLAAPAVPWGAVGLAFLGQVLLGFGPMMWLVCQLSIRQLVTPPALLGRVGAVLQVTNYGVRPLGALAGGAVAGAFGPAAGLLLAAAAFGASLLVALGTGLRRLSRMPPAALTAA